MSTSAEPFRFLNHYVCPRCANEWQEPWSCQCDDRCPECNLSCSPVSSDDINEPDWLKPPTDAQVNELMVDKDDGDRFFDQDGVYAQLQLEKDGSLTIHDFRVDEARRGTGLGRAAVNLMHATFDRIRANGVEMDQAGGAFWTKMGSEGLITSIAPVGAADEITFVQGASTAPLPLKLALEIVLDLLQGNILDPNDICGDNNLAEERARQCAASDLVEAFILAMTPPPVTEHSP